MKMALSQNIKALRKAHRMTQESLAETLGVTVGAVYKWESGQSVPDIMLILQMAELFDRSTDALLGYEWKSRNVEHAIARIQAACKEKNYSLASTEAETALTKYPNHFAIVYCAAEMYCEQAQYLQEDTCARKAIELYTHACELLSQNTDESISEVSIMRKVAQLSLCLGDCEEALRILKQYNVCGVNDSMIGMLIANCRQAPDEAQAYLGRAFSACIEDISSIMIGFLNILVQRKDYRTALDCLTWLRNTLRGVQRKDMLCYFDKFDCILLKTYAELYCYLGETERAKTSFQEALELAKRYDSADSILGVELYTKMKLPSQPRYDEMGQSAMQALCDSLSEANYSDSVPPCILALWEEVRSRA